MRLNPTVYRSSTQPLDADDWLSDITFKLEFADVALANYVAFATYYPKVPASQWCDSYLHSVPVGTTITWSKFQVAFRGPMLNHHG